MHDIVFAFGMSTLHVSLACAAEWMPTPRRCASPQANFASCLHVCGTCIADDATRRPASKLRTRTMTMLAMMMMMACLHELFDLTAAAASLIEFLCYSGAAFSDFFKRLEVTCAAPAPTSANGASQEVPSA